MQRFRKTQIKALPLAILTVLTTASGARAALDDKTSMTSDRLIHLIQTGDLRSVEDALAAAAPEMDMKRYVLMYKSRSLQAATPAAPRVILFTQDARFVMAFNGGDEGASGANTLEMIQYRDKTKSFEFREIEFSKDAPAHVSEANPAKCTACHQSPSRQNVDMRPNWEPYSFWPGAYGSNDDFVGDTRNIDGLEPQDAAMVEEIPLETGNLQSFQQQVAPSHPRYRLLGAFSRQNFELTDHLADLNFERVVRLMMAESDVTPRIRSALDYGVHCGWANAVKNEPVTAWFFAQKIPAYNNNDLVSDLLSHLYEPLGVDTSDWSMDFRTHGRFAFCDRFCTPSVPDLQFTKSWEEAVSKTSCQQSLKNMKKDLAELIASGDNEKLAARRPQVTVDVPKLLNTCATCHSHEDKTIPYINFLDPAQLKKALGKDGYERGTLLNEILYRTGDLPQETESMPPNQPLQRAESEALAKYLHSL